MRDLVGVSERLHTLTVSGMLHKVSTAGLLRPRLSRSKECSVRIYLLSAKLRRAEDDCGQLSPFAASCLASASGMTCQREKDPQALRRIAASAGEGDLATGESVQLALLQVNSKCGCSVALQMAAAFSPTFVQGPPCARPPALTHQAQLLLHSTAPIGRCCDLLLTL